MLTRLFSRPKHLFTLYSNSKSFSSINFNIHPDVQFALQSGFPVVALESTIISHGMPFPQNLQTAYEVEEIVRQNGAIPATIGIIRGEVHIGMTIRQLEEFASSPSAKKCSRRDLPFVISKKLDAGTTVAATMYLAHSAGIRLFVTGGIGGVHRNGQNTLDISADLTELSQTPVCVICAGIKSILDIKRSLEVLETGGVPVISYKTDEFPAFFSPRSGIKSPMRLNSPQEIASLLQAADQLKMNNGTVVAIPNPDPTGEEIDLVIQKALNEATRIGIEGADITPYILQRLEKDTHGRSLQSNISLIKNNAKIGAQIAVAYAELNNKNVTSKVNVDKQEINIPKSNAVPMANDVPKSNESDILVFGASIIDILGKPDRPLISATSNPGKIKKSFGGVGRNIAEGLARLGHKPLFISSIGNDLDGKKLLESFKKLNINHNYILQSNEHGTATYSAILNHAGDMVMAIADTEVVNTLQSQQISEIFEKIVKNETYIPKLAVLDGNFNPNTFKYICRQCSVSNIKIWFEPTSVPKSILPVKTDTLQDITFLSPNLDELISISTELHKLEQSNFVQDYSAIYRQIHNKYPIEIREALTHAIAVLKYMYDNKNKKSIVLTIGERGVILFTITPFQERGLGHLKVTYFPSVPIDPVDCTGAGDSLVVGVLHGLIEKRSIDDSIYEGIAVANCSLSSTSPISPNLSKEMVAEFLHHNFPMREKVNTHSFVLLDSHIQIQ